MSGVCLLTAPPNTYLLVTQGKSPLEQLVRSYWEVSEQLLPHMLAGHAGHVPLRASCAQFVRSYEQLLSSSCHMCLQVTLGMRPSEQLLWSFENALATRNDQRLHGSVINMALDASAQHAFIWVADEAKDGTLLHYVHRCVGAVRMQGLYHCNSSRVAAALHALVGGRSATPGSELTQGWA